MIAYVTFLLIGFAAGVLTGIPVGPVNVAVIDAAYRHTLRRAVAVGLGGAIADFLYCALGVAGITPILGKYPSVPPILFAVSGVILLGYGYVTVRTKPITPAAAESPHVVHRSKEFWSGVSMGLLLIILNPAAVVTWVVLVGSMIPKATVGQGLITAAGVFAGSMAWFSFVALLTHRGLKSLGAKAAWIPRVVGVALMFYAVYLLVRASTYFLAV